MDWALESMWMDGKFTLVASVILRLLMVSFMKLLMSYSSPFPTLQTMIRDVVVSYLLVDWAIRLHVSLFIAPLSFYPLGFPKFLRFITSLLVHDSASFPAYSGFLSVFILRLSRLTLVVWLLLLWDFITQLYTSYSILMFKHWPWLPV